MKVPKARKLKTGTWFIQLRLGGKSISVSGRTEKECTRQAQQIKAEYLNGAQVEKFERKKETSPTLREAIDTYIKKRDAVLSPATIRGYRTIQKTRFVEIMDIQLDKFSDKDWQMYCNQEARKISAKTLKNAWMFIASVILDATGKPAPRVKLPQIIPQERPFLEPEHIHPFIDAVHGTLVEIPALLALSSLRRSEIMAVDWDDIDFKKRTIRVQGAAVLDENNELIYKKENKNTSSARTVPIMIDELYSALKEKKQSGGKVVDCNPNTIWIQVNCICKANHFPPVGVHGLRHSFVSLAYHLGIPEKVVMDIGGWKDYQTMRRIYTHIARSDVSKYAEQFHSFFSGTEQINDDTSKPKVSVGSV